MSETFAVGDMATYTGRLAGKPLECKIIKAMPIEHAHAVRSYRIRGTAEAFDRAVPEFTLTRLQPTASELVFKS
jgi:hypothetical protein